MRALRSGIGVLGAAGILAAGCGSPSAVDELAISFTVSPAQVPSGSAFVARLAISNPTSNVISLLGLYDCIAFLKAFQDGRQVPLEGTEFDCPANFSRFPVPPRDSLVASYVLAARIRDSATSTYVPAPPGTYRLRADLNFSAPDREVEFQVVPPPSGLGQAPGAPSPNGEGLPLPPTAVPPAPPATRLSPRPAPSPRRTAAPSRTARTRPTRRSS